MKEIFLESTLGIKISLATPSDPLRNTGMVFDEPSEGKHEEYEMDDYELLIARHHLIQQQLENIKSKCLCVLWNGKCQSYQIFSK